jgi:hypothetical protein
MARYYAFFPESKSVIPQIGPNPGHLKESNQRGSTQPEVPGGGVVLVEF